jgi:hypothetical protein
MEESEALAEIRAHERECAIRWDNIKTRLERGSQRMDRLELHFSYCIFS